MTTNRYLISAIKIVAIVSVAIAVAIAVMIGLALLGRQFLLFMVGEEGIPGIDDTPLMLALVGGTYLSGGIAGIGVLLLGWLRFIRRRP